jgi:hypothetical protein
MLIIEHVINHGSPGASSLLCSFGGAFGWDKIVFRIYYTSNHLIYHLIGHWGAGRDGWRWGTLDDAC